MKNKNNFWKIKQSRWCTQGKLDWWLSTVFIKTIKCCNLFIWLFNTFNPRIELNLHWYGAQNKVKLIFDEEKNCVIWIFGHFPKHMKTYTKNSAKYYFALYKKNVHWTTFMHHCIYYHIEIYSFFVVFPVLATSDLLSMKLFNIYIFFEWVNY